MIGLWLIVHCKWLAIRYERLAISYRLFAIGYQLPSICWKYNKTWSLIKFSCSGNAITGMLTDIPLVISTVEELMPLVIALPVVAVACYQFDGVFIAATAASAMMVTMGIAFGIYILLLPSLADSHGLQGLWAAVLVFMAIRGVAQAIWYPRLESKLRT